MKNERLEHKFMYDCWHNICTQVSRSQPQKGDRKSQFCACLFPFQKPMMETLIDVRKLPVVTSQSFRPALYTSLFLSGQLLFDQEKKVNYMSHRMLRDSHSTRRQHFEHFSWNTFSCVHTNRVHYIGKPF